ncbi:MAG: FkbM family methyltransferase [Acidobacteria bacterium]|nr:FkbM family methyltransferase [Acidobacteriota bacterium]
MSLNLGYIREVGIVKWALRTYLQQISERILRRDNVLRLPTGLDIRLPRNLSVSEILVTNADIDWGAEALFTRFLDRDGVFLDVGAHVGYYSLYVLPRVAHVFAFEPDPRNLPALEWNLNRFPNATIIRKAVSSVSGTSTFVRMRDSSLGHVRRPDSSDSGDCDSLEVETTTLDDFVEHAPWRVTGIKTDVEGGDRDVLAGAEKLMRRDAPLLLAELTYTSELGAWLSTLGYTTYAFTRQRRTRRLTFARIGLANADLTKMLFLVPRRLESEFVALAGASH